MRVLVIGANGTIGGAVSQALRDRGHDVVGASRTSSDHQVDVRDPASVRALFEAVGEVDALVCALGELHFGPVAEMTPEQFRIGLDSKLMGQVHATLIGQHHVRDGGSITLTAGILSDPIRFGADACTVNHAVEGFVIGAAVDLPRGLRINAVSPGVVEESWELVKDAVPGYETVPASRVALGYVRSIEGARTGHIDQVW
ncbi:MAG TPA: short chain dehydrogenase [Aquihabitans sp.]|jgi:NAD(P)-dependent dehydrogenase (short-subunit alcohol dehydrogenase family)|nr:short chain dehydrogenase [Aquihabitans sp.]